MDELFLTGSFYIVMFHVPFLFFLALVNTLIYVKSKKSVLLTNFLLLQGILALWMISKLLKTFAPDASLKFFFVVCQYAGISLLGVLFIRFAHLFAKGYPPSKRVMRVLYGLSATMFVTVATNPWHYLFYTHFDFWGDSFGSVFYVVQGIMFVLLLIGVVLCARTYLKSFGQKRTQALLFAVAIFIPIAANILYVFRLFKIIFGFTPPFDITPISASVSLVLFAFAIFRLELFDSLNFALEKALANVPQGILLTCGGKAAYINLTLQKMIRECSLSALDGRLLVEHNGKTGAVQLSFSLNEVQDFTIQNINGGYIRIKSHPIKNGAYVSFIDITEKQAAVEELRLKSEELAAAHKKLLHQAQTQKSLVAAQIRNAMAAEAHDILGHSVILALSLLEMARVGNESNRGGYMRRAAAFLKSSLPKLMESSFDNRKRGRDVLSRMQELIEELSGMSAHIEVSAAGLIHISDESADAVYKICRESITNALRHGRCGKIDVILKGDQNVTRLYVIDDGRGCENIQKGMGIKSMEQRAFSIGGSLSCRTLGEQGFCVEAALPAFK